MPYSPLRVRLEYEGHVEEGPVREGGEGPTLCLHSPSLINVVLLDDTHDKKGKALGSRPLLLESSCLIPGTCTTTTLRLTLDVAVEVEVNTIRRGTLPPHLQQKLCRNVVLYGGLGGAFMGCMLWKKKAGGVSSILAGVLMGSTIAISCAVLEHCRAMRSQQVEKKVLSKAVPPQSRRAPPKLSLGSEETAAAKKAEEEAAAEKDAEEAILELERYMTERGRKMRAGEPLEDYRPSQANY